MPAPSNRVLLDLNSPEFQEALFALELSDLQQVVKGLGRLRGQDWNGIYGHTGLHWEAVGHIKTPTGAKAYSIRLSRKIRAIVYRHRDYLRIVSLHPDHDSAYRR